MREEAIVGVADPEQSALDVDVAAGFVELAQANYVSFKPGNEIDAGQLAMLSTVADE